MLRYHGCQKTDCIPIPRTLHSHVQHTAKLRGKRTLTENTADYHESATLVSVSDDALVPCDRVSADNTVSAQATVGAQATVRVGMAQQLYAMQQLTLPRGVPLGLRLDPTTHRIADVLPGSAAETVGISTGDVLVGLNGSMLTTFDYVPGPQDGTLMISKPIALADSNAAMANAQHTGTDLVLNLLTPHRDVAAATQDSFIPAARFAGARPGWTFKAGPQGVGYYRDESAAVPMTMRAAPTAAARRPPLPGEVYSGPFPSIKGQARPTQQQREPPSTHSLSPVHALQRAQDQQSALAHYPWATSFEDGQGQIKNRYNLPSGSMLQPMVHLDGAHKQLQSIRRKELFAAEMRPGTATASYALNR